MCVIAYGRKANFKTEWFQQCCEHNPDGFFVARVNTGDYIRTLEYEEALAFFEASRKYDHVVLHARIKSVGPINADNIHGWQDSGLQFCHNGTLSLNVQEGMTDSETLFRNVIAPLYRANRCRMTKRLKLAIEILVGNSKFLIIDKAGKVHTFGNFIEEGECLFSNMYWKSRLYSTKSTKAFQSAFFDDDYYMMTYGHPYYGSTKATKKPTTTVSVKSPPPSTSKLPILYPGDIMPPWLVLRTLLTHFGKSGITSQMLSTVLPSVSWLHTGNGVSRPSYQVLRNLLSTKLEKTRVDEILATVSLAAKTRSAYGVHKLRRWMKDYALVVLSALKPYVEDKLYSHLRQVLGNMLRHADGTIPVAVLDNIEEEFLNASIPYWTDDHEVDGQNGVLFDPTPITELESRGIYLSDIFYILFNLHTAISQCETQWSLPSLNKDDNGVPLDKPSVFATFLDRLCRDTAFSSLIDTSLPPWVAIAMMIFQIPSHSSKVYCSIIKAYPTDTVVIPLTAPSNQSFHGLTFEEVDTALVPSWNITSKKERTNK